MLQFAQFENRLKAIRNPLYVQVYETDDPLVKEFPRVGLVGLALEVQDDECLRVMADEFQNPRAGFMNHIYWEDLEEPGDRLNAQMKPRGRSLMRVQ
ncbi:Uu.00g071260.m01.CDS01 [Anthostomella pinea]|uniref:Uu.00g071260.m01.CDS01 n=1 Tax=Anthostomella pinea TaxID=933095 RepID=A0AAI8VP81_9PEZI|nr:Uu.00g071260.m01.CDS01 [Anthostomella pinea]